MRTSLLFSTLLIVVGNSNAAQVTSSTADAVGFHNCIPETNPCSVIGPNLQISTGGVPGGASASVTATRAGMGEARASVSLTGIDGAPIVHAFAQSEIGARVNTTTFALQKYTYTGDAPTIRSFGGTVSFSQAISGDYPGPNGNGVYAEIDVFQLPTATVDVGSSTDSNFLALAELQLLPGYVDLATASYTNSSTTDGGAGTLSASVSLRPGETIWIEAILSTPAPNGEVVDVSHTFVTGWNDPRDLVAASSVPEPSAQSCGVLD